MIMMMVMVMMMMIALMMIDHCYINDGTKSSLVIVALVRSIDSTNISLSSTSSPTRIGSFSIPSRSLR